MQSTLRYQDVAARLRTTLTVATEERSLRQEMNDEGEPAWVTHERQVMLDATNNELRALELNPVGEAEIRRAENLACGHIDYVVQFAGACAEIVWRAWDAAR